MSVVDDLKAVRELIADPARWTQGENARDKVGHRASPLSPDAVCWCALGAILKVTGEMWSNPTYEALLETVPNGVGYTNDTLGHAAILQAFDLAIERAGRGE